MNQMPDLQPLIASLRAEGGTDLVRRRVDPASTADVYVAIDATGTQLGVLLAVHYQVLPAQNDLPSGAGFALRTQAVKDDPKGIVNLGVFCTDTACEDIFLHFMEDIVSHLMPEGGHEQAVRVFLARVTLWQRFFVASGNSHLSEEAQSGLFAEMLILRDLIIPSVGGSVAVDAWKGPDGNPQDFVLAPCSLEVKCSRAKVGGKIPISNEQQLDERPFPHLILTLVAVTAGGGTNQSLVDMVASIRAILSATGRPLGAFNDRLITAGWIDAHAANYSEYRYFVRDVRYFEVKEGFPRIRAGDFPAGVVDITYKLEQTALMPFEVQGEMVEGWLKS